jgi:hypothetical protein
MLWGDPVYVISVDSATARVSAKGHLLDIDLDHLMETPLLEIYQIDVGQGDSTLIHTPDDRWLMVDGGPERTDSNSGRVAADFLFWKMYVDQSWRRQFNFQPLPFTIDALVCSHPDSDHYGGFNSLTPKIQGGDLQIETVFHNGMGRFGGAPFTKYQSGAGFGQLGPVEGGALPDAFLTTLIDDFDDVRAFLSPTSGRPWRLKGEYQSWLRILEGLEGNGVGALQRVHHGMGHLPGYQPNGDAVSIKILGPVEDTVNGGPGLRYLDTAGKSAMEDPSLTRNGHSVVLRFDYKDARILLTGDLNFKSQAVLLGAVPAAEFKAHVAKACHHGSDDISVTFLQAMAPWATMISSGDSEGHVHPRALMLGLTGATTPLRTKSGTPNSYLGLSEPHYRGPLLYSTELSRSVRLRDPSAVLDENGDPVDNPSLQAKKASGAPDGLIEPLDYWQLADQVTFGLINVRTDGKKILMGVLKENQASFQVETFKASD